MNATKIVLICILLFGTSTSALAEDEVMFSYSGRVRVQGEKFAGTGYFKFAIVSTNGNYTLWSNDGTGSDGGEPSGYVSADVENGIFNVMIGDPALGMEPINRIIFKFPSMIKLRVWFSDGVHGFQQLLPDRRLLNIELLALRTGEEDFTIYVNGATGNDDNNGLTTYTAKQTIQAAIDVLPARLKCNVTIEIADGVYYEQVNLMGIQTEHGKQLTVIGDQSWTPGAGGNPAVEINGSGSLREHALFVEQCYNFHFEGLHFTNSTEAVFYANSCLDFYLNRCKISNGATDGVTLMDCKTAYLNNCLATENGASGFRYELSKVLMEDTKSIGNGGQGIAAAVFSWAYLKNCESSENSSNGLYVSGTAAAETAGANIISHNDGSGIYVVGQSRVNLQGTGSISHNGQWGIRLDYMSYSRDHHNFTVSNNLSGQTTDDHGSYFYN